MIGWHEGGGKGKGFSTYTETVGKTDGYRGKLVKDTSILQQGEPPGWSQRSNYREH